MYFDELSVGMTVDIQPVTIERDRMIAFAREYDNIPLHTDEDYARSTRFGALIAPGVMSFMSVWAKYLEVDYFGEQLVAGKSTRIEWFRPVYAGDVLTARATVTALTPRNPHNGIVEITIDAYNSDNVLVLLGVTEAIVRTRG